MRFCLGLSKVIRRGVDVFELEVMSEGLSLSVACGVFCIVFNF